MSGSKLPNVSIANFTGLDTVVSLDGKNISVIPSKKGENSVVLESITLKELENLSFSGVNGTYSPVKLALPDKDRLLMGRDVCYVLCAKAYSFGADACNNEAVKAVAGACNRYHYLCVKDGDVELVDYQDVQNSFESDFRGAPCYKTVVKYSTPSMGVKKLAVLLKRGKSGDGFVSGIFDKVPTFGDSSTVWGTVAGMGLLGLLFAILIILIIALVVFRVIYGKPIATTDDISLV